MNFSPSDNDQKKHLLLLLGDNLSKTFSVMMAKESIANPRWLEMLSQIMLEDNPPYNWRAAWVIDHIHQQSPELLNDKLPIYIQTLHTIKSDGVKRHILKMATQLPVESIEEGQLVDLCFKWLQSSTTPIACKAHCMQLLFNITQKYHDLANEFGLILEEIAINGSTGEKNKAAKILGKIKKWR